MAKLLPFAAEAKRGRRSQSWTCLCQRRLRQAWSGLQLIATGAEEYQYYDFRALDRPLTRNEMAALRSISTRAAIIATSFTNHYEWGDLKANPSKLLEKYFDAFVYVANWGTREFHTERRGIREAIHPVPSSSPSHSDSSANSRITKAAVFRTLKDSPAAMALSNL
jgi:hypothetical protein